MEKNKITPDLIFIFEWRMSFTLRECADKWPNQFGLKI
jgi:hypothetical protein